MKLPKPKYTDRFTRNSAEIRIQSGEVVSIYSIADGLTDDEKNEWAKHILAHYIKESDIDRGAGLQGKTRAEYIEQMILPSTSLRNGAEVSGVFGEIVFCDFIEHILGYSVPRYKLFGTFPGNPNQGIDIVAYKLDTAKRSNDTAVYAEIKAVLSKTQFDKLQAAITDSEKRTDKDFALALDAARRKLEMMGDAEEATDIARFEDSEKPCRRIKSAGLITASNSCTSDNFVGIRITAGNKIESYVIHASDLWNLAKDLWRRACS